MNVIETILNEKGVVSVISIAILQKNNPTVENVKMKTYSRMAEN